MTPDAPKKTDAKDKKERVIGTPRDSPMVTLMSEIDVKIEGYKPEKTKGKGKGKKGKKAAKKAKKAAKKGKAA